MQHPREADLVDRIAALIDRRSSCRDDADRCSILRQVLAAGGNLRRTYAGWRDVCPPPGGPIVATTPRLAGHDAGLRQLRPSWAWQHRQTAMGRPAGHIEITASGMERHRRAPG